VSAPTGAPVRGNEGGVDGGTDTIDVVGGAVVVDGGAGRRRSASRTVVAFAPTSMQRGDGSIAYDAGASTSTAQ
jgi:hypothetical protein